MSKSECSTCNHQSSMQRHRHRNNPLEVVGNAINHPYTESWEIKSQGQLARTMVGCETLQQSKNPRQHCNIAGRNRAQLASQQRGSHVIAWLMAASSDKSRTCLHLTTHNIDYPAEVEPCNELSALHTCC